MKLFNFKGGQFILELKTWKLWGFSGICFLFAGVVFLINKNYFTGVFLMLIGLFDIFISITNYKSNKKLTKVKVSDKVLKKMDIELRNLIAEGNEIKAIKKYRTVTGFGLKEAKEHVDLLIKNKPKKLF